MQMWVCDRCKRPIQPGNAVFTIESRYRHKEHEVLQASWELCGSCQARIRAEIEKPVEAQQGQ